MKNEYKLLIFVGCLLIACILLLFLSEEKRKADSNFSYDQTLINYYLDNDGLTILDGEYLIYDNYSDYENFYDYIDYWAEDKIYDYSNNLNNLSYYEMENARTEYKEKIYKEVRNLKESIDNLNFDEKFFESNSLLIFEYSILHKVLHDISLIDICKDDDVLNVYLSSEYSGVVGGGDAVLFFVTAEKKHFKNIYDVSINIKENDSTDPGVAYKPIIYLYPEIEQDISVKLGFKDNITVSYPKYNDGWKVKAKSDGTLIEYGTNRELYALYYENLNAIDFNIRKDGFVVSKEDVVPFLEEKLEILGLNSKEIQEFIIYWLPILEKNKYNYIRFATNEEIEQNMPLNVEPSPDTIIRVLMTFKGLNEKIDVSEQELVTPIRNGYTVVEWGATIIG